MEVEPTATAREIRAAYRRLAKRYHPDKNPDNAAWARERFEQVRRAYEVLSDPKRRLLYDRQTATRRPRPRPDTAEGMAETLLELLLEERPAEALSVLDRLLQREGVSLATLDLPRYLDYGDARDCEFLLAEALEAAERTEEAILLYERALERERRRPYFRAFTEEIHDRLKRLYFRRLEEAIRAHRDEGPLARPWRRSSTWERRAGNEPDIGSGWRSSIARLAEPPRLERRFCAP
ncbi:MAG: hypothetical protein KatS3mg115_0154 [Candidatus Poribacteria bacterium]|nr:MAG: hypothetical protein KatS3mg115_0154 [Candidatus Poribacteria bacterium]